MMTSIQAAPGMVQGGSPIPPGITQQQIHESYMVCSMASASPQQLSQVNCTDMLIPCQKYKQMKEQGVRSDDPEFLKVTNLLQAITRHNEFAKQKQQHQRQIQQYQQQQQQVDQQRQQQELQQQSEQQQHNGNVAQPNSNGINGMYAHTLRYQTVLTN